MDEADTDLPDEWLARADNQPDEVFYQTPRLVAHIDAETITALTGYYQTFIPEHAAVLDLMSSWISHLPADLPLLRVAGLGMNAEELAQNSRLTDWCVHNLNTDPQLPFPPASFDVTVIAVSIQYLTQPLAVMASIHDVLRPGGKICIAMSHRLFPTKAVAAFRNLSATDRVRLVMYYLEQGGFTDIAFTDRSPDGADPLWLVTAVKQPR